MAPSNSMVSNVLAAEVAKKSGLSNVTNDQVKHILETMCQHILDTVKEGNDVSFPKFLKFKRALRKERIFKSPKTGESVVKPEHYVMTVSVMANAKKHMAESSSDDDKEPEDDEPKKKPVRKQKKAVEEADSSSDEESEPKKKPVRKQKKAVEEEEKTFVVESDSD